MLIIIKGRQRLGKTRSELEKNLRKEWGSAALSPEQVDKCRYLERKTERAWQDSEVIDSVK